MSNLSRRPSRMDLEKRGYRLVLATGAAGVATLVFLVLAIAGVTSFAMVFVLALVTATLGFAFRRTVGG
jgi:hypothetical protein